jgi:hypothetical protein
MVTGGALNTANILGSQQEHKMIVGLALGGSPTSYHV